ncbi:hypothetical protein DPX16_20669 [Anabarilius grahami]|uniref:Uncharacterized protein n=1 Tax=Anabarilius grahami TaxID=495550 RepID=A0A3N0YLG9_ANAGA|nr:hypothetical protein DPX16_20669 [Anabarilius grahami]
MTFRRVKKLNSNEPDSGSLCHDSGDIYFTSSKSDSCGTEDRGLSNSTEVYNYKTLAYSGGTLPRNFKKRDINLLLTTLYSALAKAVALLGFDRTDVSLLGSGP